MKQSNATGKYWVMFYISLAVMIAMLIWVRPYFWLALPFVVTAFSKAMNLLDDNTEEDQEWY